MFSKIEYIYLGICSLWIAAAFSKFNFSDYNSVKMISFAIIFRGLILHDLVFVGTLFFYHGKNEESLIYYLGGLGMNCTNMCYQMYYLRE